MIDLNQFKAQLIAKFAAMTATELQAELNECGYTASVESLRPEVNWIQEGQLQAPEVPLCPFEASRLHVSWQSNELTSTAKNWFELQGISPSVLVQADDLFKAAATSSELALAA